MKLIYFSFRYRHRKKELNNFLKSQFYGNIFLLNLGGPLRFFIAKILSLLNIGQSISCDGRPLIKDKSKGINFWMRGTCLNIPEDLRSLTNNYVTIKNPLLNKNNKVLQLYPINIKKSKINESLKIIYISKTLNKNNDNLLIWNEFKNRLISDFSLIDNLDFWKENFNKNSSEENFKIYTDLKIFLRHEIISYIKNKYQNNLVLIGSDWKNYFPDAKDSFYNINKIKKIYRGNICLDLGSTLGSMSLYSRSNQIIESGGLIIQSKQLDSNEIWGDMSNEILFNNLDSLERLIYIYLKDRSLCEKVLGQIFDNFKDSKKFIEKNLNEIF